jgi:MFS family permease
MACLAGFGVFELRTSFAMVPLELFRNPSFSGANLLTLFLYAAIGIFFFLFPLNLIQVQGYSSTAAGAAILPLILLMFFLSRWSGGLVVRYGPRTPLVVGPLIVALGFVLFTAPSLPHNYWKAFFPAILVLGFGMAVTVAPLTTDVMGSVDQDRVGTASGINNAVARVAGVLAIAVFGIVMVYGFRARLDRSLASFSLPSGIVEKIHAQETGLAGLQVPASLDANTRAAIQDLVRHAFVFGFRIVMVICAGLSVGSAAVAGFMIPNAGERKALN